MHRILREGASGDKWVEALLIYDVAETDVIVYYLQIVSEHWFPFRVHLLSVHTHSIGVFTLFTGAVITFKAFNEIEYKYDSSNLTKPQSISLF